MTEDTTIDDEISRRLTALADTTTTDPEAWERIIERTEPLAAPGRWSPRRPGPWLLAAAAVIAVVVGLGAALDGGGDGGTRTSDEQPAPSVTDPAPTTEPTPTMTEPPSSTTTTSVPGTDPSAGGSSGDSGGTGGVAPPQAPAPCPIDRTCVGTGSGDIDGDGGADAVGLYAAAASGRDTGPITVRVVFASREVAEHTVTGVVAAAQLLGVADLDSNGRDEVVYLHDSGASTGFGSFLGLRGGGLGPVGFTEAQPLVGGSATAVNGFSCPDVDGDGRNEVVLSSGYTDDGVTAQVRRQVYRWQGDALVVVEDTPGTAPATDQDGDGVQDFREGRSGVDCGGLEAPGW